MFNTNLIDSVPGSSTIVFDVFDVFVLDRASLTAAGLTAAGIVLFADSHISCLIIASEHPKYKR